MDHDPPAPRVRRTATYIQEAREARGFPGRLPTAEEREQQREQKALFRFEAAFSGWVTRHGTVVPQQREAFEKVCSVSPPRWEEFADWLSADAKAEVCAELRLLREAFGKELEAVGEISITPTRMTAIVKHGGNVVRQSKWRRSRTKHPDANSKALTEYRDAITKGREAISAQVEKVREGLRDLTAALDRLRPEDDPISSHALSDLQQILDESSLGQALTAIVMAEEGELAALADAGCATAHPSKRIARAFDDLGQRLQSWALPPRQPPLWRSFVEPLVRVYENASGSPPTPSWTTPRSRPGRGAADGSKGRPGNAFTAFLVMIFESLPGDVQHFVSTSAQGVYGHARTLKNERKARAGQPKAE